MLRPDVTIRAFEERDYSAIAALQKVIHGDFATPEDELRYDDANLDPKVRFARFVAETPEGEVVGCGEHNQMAGRYHPRKFLVFIDVHPEHEERGIGTALFHTIKEALRPFDPIALSSYVREECAAGLRFAARFGFVEERRIFPSDLDVAAFDPIPYEGAEERIARDFGIQLRTVAELAGDSDRDRKLHALAQLIRADFPADIPANEEPFEHWYKDAIANPIMLLDAYFVAVTQVGEYVGYSNVARDEDVPGLLWIKQTGTLREFRRQGIATALKLRGIAWAKANGYTVIRTTNDSANAAMLAINDRLGFRRQPAWIYVKNSIQEEEQS